MKLSAKADYAVRAVLVLATHEGEGSLKGELVARAQDLPLKFVENILGELKHAGIVASQRGPEGGYRLAVPASQISLAEVIRIVDGPIAAVAGVRPDEVTYPPGAEAGCCAPCSRRPPSPIWSSGRGCCPSRATAGRCARRPRREHGRTTGRETRG